MAHEALAKTIERMVGNMTDFFWDAFTALRVNDISGDYVEFGSWGANSLSLAHEAISQTRVPRHLWAFDSFRALPPVRDPRDEHPGWIAEVGEGQGGVERFHEACARRGIPRDAYTAVEGYYEDSLPPLGDDGPPTDIALAYVDCNMCSSAFEVMAFLRPRLKHGMILAFDDYFCAANPSWTFCRYKDVHWSGVSFVVERASASAP